MQKKIIAMVCRGILLLALVCGAVIHYRAGLQRYEIINFFHRNILESYGIKVFPYQNNLYLKKRHHTENDPYANIYEEYSGNQLLEQLTLPGPYDDLSLYQNKMIVSPGTDNTTLIYDLDNHLELIKELPMPGKSFLGYLDGFYVYLISERGKKETILLVDENETVTDLTQTVLQAFHNGEATEVQNSNYILYETDNFVCIGSKYTDDNGKEHLNLLFLCSKEDPQNELSFGHAEYGTHVVADPKSKRIYLYGRAQNFLGCIENGVYREITMPDIENYEQDAGNNIFQDGVFYFLLQKAEQSQQWGDYNVNQANLICDALYAFDTEAETGKFLYKTLSNQERIIGCKEGMLYLLDTKTGRIYQQDADGKTFLTTVPTGYPCMYATSYDGKTVVWGEKELDTENPVILAVL